MILHLNIWVICISFWALKSRKFMMVCYLSQEKYATDFLTKVGMKKFTTCPIPLSFSEKLSLTEGFPLGPQDITQYRSIVDSL
jgi:hypothetical protein